MRTINNYINKIGQVNIMSNGLEAIITNYNNSTDVTIMFTKFGVETTTTYGAFKSGRVKCPMICKILGKTTILRNPNTSDQWFIIDTEDLDKVLSASKYWRVTSASYVVAGSGASKQLHRLIMDCPSNMEVDHISHITTDNRKRNLRVCTHKENSRNRQLDADTVIKFKGVTKTGNCYKARIVHNGKEIYLGCFATPELAADAYNNKAKELFGEFACIN